MLTYSRSNKVRTMSKVIKGVKNVVKKITSSKLGKALLIAATIYIGGAALGAWGSPFGAINGALVKGGATAGAGSGTAAATGGANAAATGGINTAALSGTGGSAGFSVGGTTSVVTGNALPAASGGFSVGGATSTVAGTGTTAATGTAAAAGTGTGAAASGVASTVTPAAAAAAPAAAVEKVGIISKMMSGAGTFVKDNQLVSAMGVSGLANAFSESGPNQIDIMREQQRINDEDRERREANLDVSGIVMPEYRKANLTSMSTGENIFEGGLINGRRLGA